MYTLRKTEFYQELWTADSRVNVVGLYFKFYVCICWIAPCKVYYIIFLYRTNLKLAQNCNLTMSQLAFQVGTFI